MTFDFPPVPRPDAVLLALRPVLPQVLPATDDATPADFLHHTLRPVLKWQNELLLAVVADFIRDHHISLATPSCGIDK